MALTIEELSSSRRGRGRGVERASSSRPERQPGRVVQYGSHHGVRRAQHGPSRTECRDGHDTFPAGDPAAQLRFERGNQPGRQFRQRAAEHDRLWIEEVHGPGQSDPEGGAGCPAKLPASGALRTPPAGSARRPRPARRRCPRLAGPPPRRMYCSRQPRPPQGQAGPSGCTGTCPSSPTKPRVPRSRCPSTTIAAPIPISAETWMKSAGVSVPSQSSARRRSSPRCRR